MDLLYQQQQDNSGSSSENTPEAGNCMEILLDKVKKTIQPHEAPPRLGPIKKRKEPASKKIAKEELVTLSETTAPTPTGSSSVKDSRSSVSDCDTVEKRYKKLFEDLEAHQKRIDTKLEQTCDDLKAIVNNLTEQTKREFVESVKKEIASFCEDIKELERETWTRKQQKLAK